MKQTIRNQRGEIKRAKSIIKKWINSINNNNKIKLVTNE